MRTETPARRAVAIAARAEGRKVSATATSPAKSSVVLGCISPNSEKGPFTDVVASAMTL